MLVTRDVKIRIEKSVKLANVSGGEKILDLGCGDMKLRQFLPDTIEYTGIDINVGTIHHDLEKGLPLNLTGKFDVIFMNEFIEHIENFKTLLIQCNNIISDGGRIIISTPSTKRILYGDVVNNGRGEDLDHIHAFRKTNMFHLAEKCNLKITKIRGTYIRMPPLSKFFIPIPTNQTFYTEVICYRLEKMTRDFIAK
jgi:SAM-dependent methyltransferase